MSSDEDEKYVSSQTWNKMEKCLHQEGYREGVSAGRDLTFQQGFDVGYHDGFDNGYKLGLHNGIIGYLNSNISSLDTVLKEQLSAVQSIERPGKGLCVVCSEEENNKEYSNNATSEDGIPLKITEIKQMQAKQMLDNEKPLFTDNYLLLLKSTKLNKLFNK